MVSCAFNGDGELTRLADAIQPAGGAQVEAVLVRDRRGDDDFPHGIFREDF